MENTQNATKSHASEGRPASREDALFALIAELIAPIGYEPVHVEILNQRQKTLRLFIDRLDGKGIGIEDCVIVTKALDEPLENHPTVEAIFKGPYELEVSSPGLDRPLRGERDFQRFKGKRIRLHTFRALQATELGNDKYAEKNPRQKNFLGELQGVGPTGVLLKVETHQISVPLNLVSKAHLEPEFDFDSKESE